MLILKSKNGNWFYILDIVICNIFGVSGVSNVLWREK